MRVLSLDSSLSKTGWAVLNVSSGTVSVDSVGLIKTDAKKPDGERLRQINDGIMSILSDYPDIHTVIPIEEGIVRFNTATKQIAKARGVIEFSLEDYTLEGVNISTVKAWARRHLNAPKSRKDKAVVAEAVEDLYGSVDGLYTARGKLVDDISDAIAVGTVWAIKHKYIEEAT